MGAGNILTVTSAGHGLIVGRKIVITDGTTENPLATATLVDGTVEFNTTYDHDLIRPSQPGDDQYLYVAGFGSVWDGQHAIIDVPNRQTFVVNLPSGETLAPVLGGSEYLIEPIPPGAYPVATVPNVDQFTIAFPEAPPLAIGDVNDMAIIAGFRIAAAANYDRAKAAYSEQGADKNYLFVIMGDMDVSKSRHSMTDGIASFTQQDARLLTLLQNFSTTIFIPTTTEISGADAQDLAYGTINTALLQALFGAPFNDDSIIKYRTVPVGHGPGQFVTAYYTHVYDWQVPFAIDLESGFMIKPDVAFRDITQTFALLADEEAEMVVNIDLDDEPL